MRRYYTPVSAESSPQPDAAEALCRAAAAGDADALARVLALHHDRLLEHAIRRVGPDWRGKIEPEDVLQEAYFDIFSAIRGFTYGGHDSIYRWAVQIVDRRYVDQVRRHRAKKRDVVREKSPALGSPNRSTYHGLLETCLPDSRTPSRFASTGEAVSAVMSGLARLPEDYRKVLRCMYLDGEPLEAVALELGRSPEAVRRLAARALERLRHTVAWTAS